MTNDELLDELTKTSPGGLNPFEPSYPKDGSDFGRYEEDGTEFPRYENLQAIGQGGMGRVYKARDRKLQRDVAVKVLAAGAMIAKEQHERFRAEIATQSSVNIPGVVTIFDAGRHDDWDYYVMELVDGHELKHWVRAKKPSLKEKRDLLIQLAGILSRVHAEDIVHRDIKPSNIMITRGGDPMLMDFGIAKSLKPELRTDLTQPNAWPGTPRYMSPDLPREMQEDLEIAKKADVYSLAVVGYELLCGRLPHEVENLDDPFEVLTIVRDTAPRSITETCPDVAGPVADAVMGGLVKDHSLRPSPDKFAEQLGDSPGSTESSARGSALTILIGAVAVLALGAGVYAALRANNTPELGGQKPGPVPKPPIVKRVEPTVKQAKIWINASPPELQGNWQTTKDELKTNHLFAGKGALLFEIPSGAVLKVEGGEVYDSDFKPMATVYRLAHETVIIKLYETRTADTARTFKWKPVAGQVDCLR